MKKIVFILILGILICGCKKKNEEESPVEFNYEKSFKVIKECLGCEDRKVQVILENLERAKVSGVISAKKSDEKFSDFIIIEIISEEEKEYRLYMTESFFIHGIKDMETEKFIYQAVM